MSMRCQDFIEQLEQWAPIYYAEEWDNPGLEVGERQKEIQKVLVALTPSEQAVETAVQKKVDLLLTHHPLIFQPMKQINDDTATGRSVLKLIQHKINFYCAHTNLDIAAGGVNDILATRLQLQQVELLADIAEEPCVKLVVYVPVGYEDIVRQAICNAGAGCIGNYKDCTFQMRGVGTFLPEKGTHPFLGEAGILECAEEYRLETIVPEKILNDVVQAMQTAHPYEEVAYDIFRLENGYSPRGIGRIGTLKTSMRLNAFLEFVSTKLQCDHLTYQGILQKEIKTVALCGGSGISYLTAAKKAGADVYITGDVKYHDAQAAKELGIMVVDAGHFGTERWITKALAEFTAARNLEVETFEEEDFLQYWRKN